MTKWGKGRNPKTRIKLKLLNDMKKTYVSPLTSEVSVKAEVMMDASVQIFNNTTTVNTKNEGVQLGNTHRGEWGNLWAK